jgi:hypothetical protein
VLVKLDRLDAVSEATGRVLGAAAHADVIRCLYERIELPDGLRSSRRRSYSRGVPIHSVGDAQMVIRELVGPTLVSFIVPWMESARDEDGALAASQQDFGGFIAHPTVLALAFNRYEEYLRLIPLEWPHVLRDKIPKLFDYLRAQGELDLPPGVG